MEYRFDIFMIELFCELNFLEVIVFYFKEIEDIMNYIYYVVDIVYLVLIKLNVVGIYIVYNRGCVFS